MEGTEIKPKWKIDWVGFLYAGIGLAFVPIINSTAITRMIAWVLDAVVHEGGHTLMALALGQPALPRVSLDGHVPFTSVGPEQYVWVCFVVWIGLVFATIRAYEIKFLRITATALLILYPFIAFNQIRRELAITLAGHGGELLFAGICLWRAQTGLFTHHRMERAAYAIVGWYLVFTNISMCAGILFNPETREAYLQGPEEGHINDYVVAAYDILIWTDVRSVAGMMLGVSILVYPIALLYARGVKR